MALRHKLHACEEQGSLSIFLLAAGCLGLLVCLNGCSSGQQTNAHFDLTGHTMGTTYSVKVVDPPTGIEPQKLQAEIDAVLVQVNEEMSTYLEDSDLSQFNRHPGTDWFPVSPGVVTVVERALKISRVTDGAFDVTVGPLVNLWNFGPERRAEKLPTAEEIETAQALVGSDRVDVRTDPPALRKTKPGVYVDLSAIAKGYGVDLVADLLQAREIKNYLVEIGGEVRVEGRNATGERWRVGIESPQEDTRQLYKAVELVDLSMATSGNYRNFFDADGKRYSHTIDPRTGQPVTHKLVSVSVITEACVDADGWATAFTVLGPEKAQQVAAEQNLAVLGIVQDESGLQEWTSPAWDVLMREEQAE